MRLPSRPELYTHSSERIERDDRSLDLELVTPRTATHAGVLILFATGDAGWWGTSHELFEHMAERGYTIAAYDSRAALRRVRRSGGKLTFDQGADIAEFVLVEAKRKLALPDSTPVIITGFSRGAGMVVFAAGEPTLQHGIAGAVAIALTREGDYMRAPAAAERPASIQVDERGRIQTYPALARLGDIKIAVLQSTGDSYVPAAEARNLFGPDTPTRRLYAVEARNHGFAGGEKQLLESLDAALAWIETGAGH